MTAAGPVFAQDVPYDCYTYTFSKKEPTAVYSPAPYYPVEYVDSQSLGTDLGAPKDICYDASGNFYIVDMKLNKVIITDSNFKLIKEISEFTVAGETDVFNAPEGIFVTDNNKLYVADTGNGRVVSIDLESEEATIYPAPISDTLKDFEYHPQKLAVDKTGRFYVVAKGQVSGLMEFAPDGTYAGFMGGNYADYSQFQLIWKKILTPEQANKMIQFIPVEYSNVSLDQFGFLYVVSSAVKTVNQSENKTVPIKRLNPSGKDVLVKEGYQDEIKGDEKINSLFADICVDENEVYYALDINMNRIFAYNRDGYLLYVFGGRGVKFGTFTQPSAIEVNNGQLIVADESSGGITVFGLTEYGSYIRDADSSYNKGEYEKSMEGWNKVLQINANYELAYAQIGKVLVRQNEPKKAMEYFKLGNYRGGEIIETGYNKAFNMYRQDFLIDHMGIILTVLSVATVFGIAIYFVLRHRKRVYAHSSSNEPLQEKPNTWGNRIRKQIKFALHVPLHPFDCFWDIKSMGYGKMSVSLTIICLLVVSNIFSFVARGFLFNYDIYNPLNIIDEIRNVFLLFLLFCVANWSITALFDGEGSFKDIVMVFGYSALPMVLIQIPLTIMTNVASYNEKVYIVAANVISWGWFFALLFVGIMTVHQYTAMKTFLTLLLTVIAMVILVFICTVFYTLVWQMVGFIFAIVKEINLRI